MVGERGPELMHVPRGADIVPNDRIGAAAGVTIQAGAFVFQYPIMDTPQARNALAAIVGDAIMSRLRSGGVRVPSGA